VVLYFLVDDRPTAVTRSVTRPASLSSVLGALAVGPQPSDVGFTPEMRSVVPSDLVRGVDEQAGVAVVDLSTGLEVVPGPDQRLVFAQLVLTLRQQRGVGQVRFTEDGLPTVALRGDGEATRPDEVLTEKDYEVLLSDTGEPPVATPSGGGATAEGP
jgi:spore germination protein GerM